MAMYRVHNWLYAGKQGRIAPGSLVRLEWLKPEGIERLTIKGSITRIHAPPLAVFPSWHADGRARKAKEVLAIENAEQLLEADEKLIAEKMEVDVAEVQRWKGEILTELMVTPSAGG